MNIVSELTRCSCTKLPRSQLKGIIFMIYHVYYSRYLIKKKIIKEILFYFFYKYKYICSYPKNYKTRRPSAFYDHFLIGRQRKPIPDKGGKMTRQSREHDQDWTWHIEYKQTYNNEQYGPHQNNLG